MIRHSSARRAVLVVAVTLFVLGEGCGGAVGEPHAPSPSDPLPSDYEAGPIRVPESAITTTHPDQLERVKVGVRWANAVLQSKCFREQFDSNLRFTTTTNSPTQVFIDMRLPGDFKITFFHGSWAQNHLSRTVGYENDADPGHVHMNDYFVNDAWGIASNLLHEVAHARGYRHARASDSSSVPYKMNAIFATCADKLDRLDLAIAKVGIPSETDREKVDSVRLAPDARSDSLPLPTSTLGAAALGAATLDRRVRLACALAKGGEVQKGDSPRSTQSAELPPSANALLEALDRATSKRVPEDHLKRERGPVAVVGGECDHIASGTLGATELAFLDRVSKIDGASYLQAAKDVIAAKSNSRLPLEAREQSLAFVGAETAAPAPDAAHQNLGSLEATLLNGLADFVVTRARAEAIAFVKSKLVEAICNDETTNRGKHYLAATCSALTTLDPTLSLQATGVYLHEAIERDLRRLPEAILANRYVSQRTPREQALLFGLAYFREVATGRQPLEVAWSIRKQACQARSGGPWLGSLDDTACVTSELVTVIEQAPTLDFTSPKSVALLVAALLDVARTDFGPDVQLTDVEKMLPRFREPIEALRAVERDAKALERSGRDASTRERVALANRAFATVIDLSRLASCIRPEAGPCRGAGDLDAAADVAELGTKLLENDIAAATARASVLLLGLEGSGLAVPASVQRYLPFLTEIASAKSSKDVASTFEAAAAPVGSAASKFERSGVAINALLGAHLGTEIAAGDSSGAIGVFAPVGVHGWVPAWNQLSFGVFLTVIDIGTLTQTRLSGGDVSQEPHASFAQLFSPGLYGTMGIGRTPLMLGVGASASPEARKHSTRNVDVAAVRIGAFLAFDIPLFPF